MKSKIQNFLEDSFPEEEFLLADGFEEAFVGVACGIGRESVACYDKEKCINILMKDMSREDAEEYFSFNVEGAWVGEKTPMFLVKIE